MDAKYNMEIDLLDQNDFLNHGSLDSDKITPQFTVSECTVFFDNDASSSLDLKEFTKGINQYSGGELSDDQIKQLFSMVDIDGSGSIDCEQFMMLLRPQMNPTRLAIVEEAFQKLEKHMNGELELDQRQAMDILDRFDETGNQDGKVTKEEFVKYYSAMSADIDNDTYFAQVIRQDWNL